MTGLQLLIYASVGLARTGGLHPWVAHGGLQHSGTVPLPARADDAGASAPGHLHRQSAYRSAGTVDQHGLPRLQVHVIDSACQAASPASDGARRVFRASSRTRNCRRPAISMTPFQPLPDYSSDELTCGDHTSMLRPRQSLSIALASEGSPGWDPWWVTDDHMPH